MSGGNSYGSGRGGGATSGGNSFGSSSNSKPSYKSNATTSPEPGSTTCDCNAPARL